MLKLCHLTSMLCWDLRQCIKRKSSVVIYVFLRKLHIIVLYDSIFQNLSCLYLLDVSLLYINSSSIETEETTIIHVYFTHCIIPVLRKGPDAQYVLKMYLLNQLIEVVNRSLHSSTAISHPDSPFPLPSPQSNPSDPTM